MIHASNFELSVTGGDVAFLMRVLATVLEPCKVSGYEVMGNRLVLYWHDPERLKPNYTRWPMTSHEAVAHFVCSWLAGQAEYGPRPDIDGSVRKGWHLLMGWAHARDEYAQLVVDPYWLEFHK